jgi:hypothetical protein
MFPSSILILLFDHNFEYYFNMCQIVKTDNHSRAMISPDITLKRRGYEDVLGLSVPPSLLCPGWLPCWLHTPRSSKSVPSLRPLSGVVSQIVALQTVGLWRSMAVK